MDEKSKKIGGRIRLAREATGKSQKEFAAAINASFRAQQDYEAGVTVPGGRALEGLAELGFNVNWILTGTGPMRLSDETDAFPMLSDIPLLEATIKSIDLFFSEMKITPPAEVRGRLIALMYREVRKNQVGPDHKAVANHFSEILAQR